jgi:chromate transporter
MVPVLQDAIVIKDRLLSQTEFMEGLAICNMLSGPMIVNFGLYLGYSISGWAGAFIAGASIVSVVFIWSSLSVKAFDLLKNKPMVIAILAGMRIGVVVIMFMAAVNMFDFSLVRNFPAMTVGIILFTVSAFTRINPAILILSAGLIGMVFGFS